MVHALRSRRVVTPQGELDATVVIEDEIITAVHKNSNLEPGTSNLPTEDLGSLALLPGLIDAHTHINEPGRTEWEGFRTATLAAAAGGFTTLVDMPLNCLPETTDPAALELKRDAARGQCMVDVAFWGGCVDGNQHQIEPLALAGVAGFKSFLIYPGCDGFTMIDQQQLEAALPDIAASGLPLLVHAELAGPIEAAAATLHHADWRRYATYLASRPDEAELQAIRLMIRLCRQYRFRLHIVHLSTALALDDIRAARAEGLPLTIETCPHYLHFAAEDIPDGATLLKCAPPIRSRANQTALWQALREGTIDMVVTDHSPCPPEMKRTDTGRFDQAWGGIASLSVALPVLHTDALRHGFTLDHLVRWMSSAPAALAGLSDRAGALAPGRDASFVLFDTEASQTVSAESLHFRHPISPYTGQTLRGVVQATYLRGDLVFHQGQFAAQPSGRELQPVTSTPSRYSGPTP